MTGATAPADAGAARLVPGLDGIRGIAILLVILWHCAPVFSGPAQGALAALVGHGWAGVDLFFALSGFLITGLVMDEERASGRRLDLRRFYIRRALRIFPAFYLVLLLDLVLLRFLPPFQSLAGALRHGSLEAVSLATYWSNYFYFAVGRGAAPPALGIFWSLCVEEHFYLFWPLFLASVRATSARVAVAAACCVLMPLARWATLPSHPLGVNVYSHLRMDSLLWGALAALLLPRLLCERRAVRLLLACSTCALLVLIAPTHLGLNVGTLGPALELSLLAFFASALGLEVTLAPRGLLAHGLSLPPLRAIGRISYGMYLIHFQVIDLARPLQTITRDWPGPFAFLVPAAVVVAGTFVVAGLLYRFYERPFLRLKGRFTPPRAALAPAAAAPSSRTDAC